MLCFAARHTIVNDPMADGTHLESACHIAASANAFQIIACHNYTVNLLMKKKSG